MSDEPNAKRRRTDDTETPLTRSTEHWFDDGSIILQVEATQFRIHKSILSLHSSVFRDMFTVPQPANEPLIEGCAKVSLSGDTVQDWIFLLNAMYPADPTPPTEVEIPSFGVVTAFLRLGKKYDMPLFQKDAVRRLKFEYPHTFAGWQERAKAPWSQIFPEIYMESLALPLAREVGLHSIRPALYFHSALDGDMMSKILDDSDSMPPAERLTCLRGYFKLMDLQASTTLEWLYREGPPSTNCRSVDKCNAGKKLIICLIHNPRLPEIWIDGEWENDWNAYLCTLCAKEGKKMFDSGNKKWWDKLPSIYDLPDWPELIASDFDHE
ncbi:hypothetical protein C8J57DRAFT_1476037 [Mycena rebaudengoi]|nr:hypothetical protein C8J57DRAFT_1476037 [Mycena rebaudengoi]